MKIKNIIIAVMATFIFATALCGCGDKTDSQANAGDPQSSEKVSDANDKDSINNKNQKAVTDSLVFELKTKVSDVQNKYAEIDEQLKLLESNDKELKKAQEEGDSLFATSNMILIMCIAIALIVAIIALLKINSKNETIDTLKKEIRGIKNEMSNRQTNNNISAYRPASHNDDNKVKSLSERVAKLEVALHKKNTPQTYTTLPPAAPSEVYFGSPVKAGEDKCYFEEVNSFEKARFSAKIERNEASFTPMVNLSALKGSDILDRAIEFVGTATLNRASQMQVKQPGRATKHGKEWHVYQKAIVHLS